MLYWFLWWHNYIQYSYNVMGWLGHFVMCVWAPLVELYLNGTRTFKLTAIFLVKNDWDDVRNHQKKCTKVRTWGTLVIRVQSVVSFMTSLHLIYDGAPWNDDKLCGYTLSVPLILPISKQTMNSVVHYSHTCIT